MSGPNPPLKQQQVVYWCKYLSMPDDWGQQQEWYFARYKGSTLKLDLQTWYRLLEGHAWRYDIKLVEVDKDNMDNNTSSSLLILDPGDLCCDEKSNCYDPAWRQ